MTTSNYGHRPLMSTRGYMNFGAMDEVSSKGWTLLCRNDQPAYLMTELSSLINFPMGRWP